MKSPDCSPNAPDGLLDDRAPVKVPFHPFPALHAHLSAFFAGACKKFFHCFDKALRILFSAQEAALSRQHRLAAPRNVRGDERAAGRGRLEQNVAHALVPAGQDHAVCPAVPGPRVLLKAVEADNALVGQLLYPVFHIVVEEAHEIEVDRLAVLRLDRLRGRKELFDALFLHQSYQIQEMDPVIFRRVRLHLMIAEVHARPVEQCDPVFAEDPPAQEFAGIFRIFKENGVRAFERLAVERACDEGGSLALEHRSQALNVHAVRDPEHPASKACVDVGLDRVGDRDVRPLFFQEPDVEADEPRLFHRIDAAAVELCLDHAAAHVREVVLVARKRRGDHDLSVLYKLRDQLPTELPEHIGMIRDDQIFHLSSSPAFAPVPPST